MPQAARRWAKNVRSSEPHARTSRATAEHWAIRSLVAGMDPHWRSAVSKCEPYSNLDGHTVEMAITPVRKHPNPIGDSGDRIEARRPGIVHPADEVRSSLEWRAIVHARDRDFVVTEWHLVNCAAPGDRDAHCPVGQELFDQFENPDGHCLVLGRCVRCADEQIRATAQE